MSGTGIKQERAVIVWGDDNVGIRWETDEGVNEDFIQSKSLGWRDYGGENEAALVLLMELAAGQLGCEPAQVLVAVVAGEEVEIEMTREDWLQHKLSTKSFS